MWLPAMFVCLPVCLTVSKITQKHVHGFGWNFACQEVSGHGRTGQLLSPIRIIVRMPEPENLKVEHMSKSVKQAPHSEQATGHGMHCREILFTKFTKGQEVSWVGRLFCTTYGCRAMGHQSCPIFGFWPISPHKTPKTPKYDFLKNQAIKSWVSEWVCSFLTAHQHKKAI